VIDAVYREISDCIMKHMFACLHWFYRCITAELVSSWMAGKMTTHLLIQGLLWEQLQILMLIVHCKLDKVSQVNLVVF